MRACTGRRAMKLLGAIMLIGLGAGAAHADEAAQAVRLTVLISVDQLRADYLTRFAPHFEAGGFRRLMDQGAFFPNAYVPYGASETAPGHATIGTGALPRQHGIVGNKWFLKPGVTKPQQPVDDPNVQFVGVAGGESGAPSPHALLAPTLGDEIKLSDHRSRVYSVALKDRAAIYMAGRSADGVYWCDKPTGRIVTSTYYTKALPAALEALNAAGGAWQYAGQTWKPLLGSEVYASATPSEAGWSTVFTKVGAAFPHTLPAAPTERDGGYSELVFATPFGNDLVLEMARTLVHSEKLGRGPALDLLCIGLSSNDYVGHFFGPDSAEVLDMTLRTDRQLAALLRWLDAEVGREDYLVALTADHGIGSSPYPAGQLRLPVDTLDTSAVAKTLESVWREALGGEAAPQPLLLGINTPWVYCAPEFAELDARLGGKLTQAAMQALRRMPGIADVLTEKDLSGTAPTVADGDRLLAWRSYHAGRSGQFYLWLAPGWIPRDKEDMAAHAVGSRSDRHVPILLAGPGVRCGRYYAAAELTDLAPTLAALLGIEAPAESVGRVLSEAVAGAPAAHSTAEPHP